MKEQETGRGKLGEDFLAIIQYIYKQLAMYKQCAYIVLH